MNASGIPPIYGKAGPRWEGKHTPIDPWDEVDVQLPSDAELDAAMLMLPEARPGECVRMPAGQMPSIQKLKAVSQDALEDRILTLKLVVDRSDQLRWPKFQIWEGAEYPYTGGYWYNMGR
jgi:hypothetical protein